MVGSFLKKHWPALLAIALANIFIYLFTKHSGIGISPDSVNYFSAATNIRRQFSFTDYNGLPLVDFPLGYPVFLACVSFVAHTGILTLAPVVNAILLSFVILCTSVILKGYRKTSWLYGTAFLSLLAFSPGLLEVYSMLWSETLFLFFSLLFFICFRYYTREHSYARLLLPAVVAAMAFVTRYAGISFLLTGGLLLLFDGDLPIRKKIGQLFVFGATGISLVVVNLVHNHLVTQSLTGVREKALRSVSDNLVQAGAVLTEWLPFLKSWPPAGSFVFVVLFIVAVLSFFFKVLQQQYYHSYETIVSAYFISYILFLVIVASVSRFEDLSNRLLSPVYIPLLLVGSSWIVPVAKKSVGLKKWIVLFTCFLFYAGIVAQQYKQNADAWEGIKDAGMPGYAENSWQTSTTIHYLRSNKNNLLPELYSDAPDAVFFLAGLHARPLPHKEIDEEINALLQKPLFTVIWLDDGFNDDLIGIDLIKQHKTLIGLTRLADGAIYYFADPGYKNR